MLTGMARTRANCHRSSRGQWHPRKLSLPRWRIYGGKAEGVRFAHPLAGLGKERVHLLSKQVPVPVEAVHNHRVFGPTDLVTLRQDLAGEHSGPVRTNSS